MRCRGVFFLSSAFKRFTNYPVVGVTRFHPQMYWDDFGLKCRELDFKYFMWRLPMLV
jgi:hypothetical protein